MAVNLKDLDRLTPMVKAMLLQDKVDLTKPILTDPANPVEEAAVGFTCPLLTAAIIGDILRSHDREAGDRPTCLYLKVQGVWRKIPGNAVLVLVTAGGQQLNPNVFDASGWSAEFAGSDLSFLEGGE